MKVSIKKVKRRPEEGAGATFYAEYPVFSPDEYETANPPAESGEKKRGKTPKIRRSRMPLHENLNRAVENFVESAAKSGKQGEIVTVTNHIYRCDDSIISFSLDVARKSESSLVYIRRFCFNWDCKAGVLLPLSAVTGAYRKLKKENGGTSDYTISGGMLYMHKNTFTREAGQNVRRKKKKKFLSTAAYDLSQLENGAGDECAAHTS